MTKRLLVIAGPDKGRSFLLPDASTVVIGRGRESATRLNDPHVSRFHCRVEVRDGGVTVTDSDSAGGRFVNDRRVSRHQLQSGDVIQVGETRLCYHGEDPAEQSTIAPPEALSEQKTLYPGAAMMPPPRLARRRPAPAQPRTPAAAATITEPTPPAARRAGRPAPLPFERLGELANTTLSHFQLGPVIARGQSGVVFRARDFKNNRHVALKVLRPEFATDDREVQRFVRSMKTALPLQHPNLVRLYGAGKKGGYCWISMEFVDGESLTQVIARIAVAGMLDWRHAHRVALHIGRALEFAHRHHIIHRNITPANVLIQASNTVAKLGDLMLAKALEGRLAQHLTASGELLGDIRYMSPERTHSPEGVDGRSDIYSLGALVYCMLTGQPPFQGYSIVETVTKIREGRLEPPRKFQLSIPASFERVVLTMLARRPEDRYQKAQQLLATLAAVKDAGGKQ
jgi:tRNA A-37 threonylcarbamoyl transferase component Bud32